MFSLDLIISKLQKERLLPTANYSHLYWEQQFSFIYKVSFKEAVYFFKVLKPRHDHNKRDLIEKLKDEYEALVKFNQVFKEFKEFNIPEPIYFSADDMVLVTREIKGISAEYIINRYARRINKKEENVDKVVKNIASFLKILHKSESHPYTILDVHDLKKYIEDRLLIDEFTISEQEKVVQYLNNTCAQIQGDISRYSKSPVHHDLNPTNILVHGGQINVLDFGDSCMDHYFQDIIYFILMLEGQLGSRIKYKQSSKKELIAAFYEGYDFDVQKLSKDNLYKLYLLKNLSIFFKTLSMRNKEKIRLNLSINCLKMLVKRLLSYKDFYMVKKRILEILREE